MEKIYFDETTYNWKTKLNKVTDKIKLLQEAKVVIESAKNNTTDGYGYMMEWNSNINFNGNIKIKRKLDEIIQLSIDKCKKIYEEKNITYNKSNMDSWVNMVRSNNPVQVQFKYEELRGVDKYHIHTDINKGNKKFAPHYTWVYYIQMPDIMEEEDGVLYFRGKNKKEYWIRPEEDDLIIMEEDMPHAPNNAPSSTVDRIVIAGNIGFENIKKTNSLI